jgi:hypothetical protein
MNQSIILFLVGCIPARVGLGLAARYIPANYLYIWATAVLLMAVGFLFLFFTGKRSVGPETGGKPIWWKPFRLFHGLTYLSAAIAAFNKNGVVASNIIFADTVIGLGLFGFHHFIQDK